ncbi:MAG: nucleoside deaminase [Acidobacteriota bacterium]|nr:nucleoside deaminase [Acidobacteriota bacterium]MDH3528323.1 nucleoside deaminase [Acidobacteriota bacterium]
MTDNHEKFMRRAIELARNGVESNHGGPFGALVVKNGEVLGEGWNRVTSTNDPTAHAEIIAIRAACKALGSFQLEECVVYSSCEPCPMCLGAIYWARPSMLVFAGRREDAARAGFDDQFIYDEIGKSIDSRTIKTKMIMSSEATEVFQLWIEKEDKIAY